MEDNGVIQSTFHTLSKPNIHEMIMTNTSEWPTLLNDKRKMQNVQEYHMI